MRHKMVTASILAAALFTFAAGAALAQRDQAAQTQTTPQTQATQPGMMGGNVSGGYGMMGNTGNTGGNTGYGMMGQMMNRNKEMSEIMTKLMASMQAIENEKNPTALKQKLAEHRALLDQMRGQMTPGGMMQNVPGMMGNYNQPPTK